MKILLVEDDTQIALALQDGLKQERYIVDWAKNGEAGFDLAVSEKYSLIILDLMLPKKDGLTFCKELRTKEHLETPILMLTAKGLTADKVFGLNEGADDYL